MNQPAAVATPSRPNTTLRKPRAIHSAIDYLTPTEYEQAYYRENTSRKHPLPGEPALH